MVGRNGGAFGLAGFIFFTGMLTPIRLATSFSIEERGPYGSEEEATTLWLPPKLALSLLYLLDYPRIRDHALRQSVAHTPRPPYFHRHV